MIPGRSLTCEPELAGVGGGGGRKRRTPFAEAERFPSRLSVLASPRTSRPAHGPGVSGLSWRYWVLIQLLVLVQSIEAERSIARRR